MTVFHRLRVWIFKAIRFVRFGFRTTRSRGAQIFLSPVWRACDFCDDESACIVLEGDYEVYSSICAKCLDKCTQAVHTDGLDSTPRMI